MSGIDQLEGGPQLCDWFEGVPSFHDATLSELELRQGGISPLVAQTFKMTSEIDQKGFFVLTKHVPVTFEIFDLISVELSDFQEAGIIAQLDIASGREATTLSVESSYGVHGHISAKRMTVSFEPAPLPSDL